MVYKKHVCTFRKITGRLLIAALLLHLFSCRSAQQLIEAGCKKDPSLCRQDTIIIIEPVRVQMADFSFNYDSLIGKKKIELLIPRVYRNDSTGEITETKSKLTLSVSPDKPAEITGSFAEDTIPVKARTITETISVPRQLTWWEKTMLSAWYLVIGLIVGFFIGVFVITRIK